MRKLILAALLALAPFAAFADEDKARAEERAALLDALAAAPSQEIGNAAAAALWRLWSTAPDDTAQALFDAGVARMAMYDNEGAVEFFTKLTEYAPDYAEGWNQRAFAYFRMEEYEKSLEDITETLDREPQHFGALAGRVQILMRQGRVRLARRTLDEALEIHPFVMDRNTVPDPQ